MVVSPESFKLALSAFASGVTVVTVAADGELHGMTASSFAAVSLDPPLILVCLDKESRTRALVVDVKTFGVNILSAGQEAIARAFALPGIKPFAELEHRLGEHGAPLLEGAIAWLECRIDRVIEAGDHDIVIGEVLWCDAPGGAPLIYYDRTYRR